MVTPLYCESGGVLPRSPFAWPMLPLRPELKEPGFSPSLWVKALRHGDQPYGFKAHAHFAVCGQFFGKTFFGFVSQMAVDEA